MDKDFLKELFAELEKDNASNVVPLHESPDPRVSAAKVLLSALETVLESVLVLGYGDDGEPYAEWSTMSDQDILWMLETFKHRLLADACDEDVD